MSGRGSNLNAGSSSPGHRAQAASRRAAGQGSHSPASSRELPWGEHRPGVKGDGQGTRAVPGIGFARLRPARRRLCRQGVNSAAGPGGAHHCLQADSSRSDIPCGATSRSRNTFSQRSPGFVPGAPPALPDRLVPSGQESCRKGNQPMSRSKTRRAIRPTDASPPEDLAPLRAELERRLDLLRAVVEDKRRIGWTVVRCPAPPADPGSRGPGQGSDGCLAPPTP